MLFQANRLFQSAWVVADLHAAIRDWTGTCGVGPFFVAERLRLNVTYRGTPAPLEIKVALAQAGDVQIELIEPLSPGPSVYRDSVPPGSSGFHHMGALTDDVEAEIARCKAAGLTVAMEGQLGPRPFAYVDTRATFGFMLEVVQASPTTLARNKMVADAAADWDGQDPVRILEFRPSTAVAG